MSFCTGAFLLAEAGLLDGLPATTLWAVADRFRGRPGADLALHIVRSDYGAEIAIRIARQMVAPPHRRGGQAQYVEAPLGNHADRPDRLSATL